MFLRLEVRNFYIWGLGILPFGGKFSSFSGLVILTFGSYFFLRLRIRDSYVWG